MATQPPCIIDGDESGFDHAYIDPNTGTKPANVDGIEHDGDGEHARIPQPVSGAIANTEGLSEYETFRPLDFNVGTATNSGSPNGTTSRRRGRPPGSRNRAPGESSEPRTPQKVQSDLGDVVSDLLYSVHLMGANLMDLPELKLEKSEASELAAALKEVQKHYPTVAVDPKKMALLNFTAVASGIYITRGIAIWKRPTKAPGPLTLVQKRAPEPTVKQDAKQTAQPQTPSEMWNEDMSMHVPEG